MGFLLDAHALIWWLGDDARLSAPAREAIETSEEALVGAGTLVEIAIKRSLEKLDIDDDWPEQAQADGFAVLAISWAHIACLQDLPYLKIAGAVHRDPFDRLLTAQALRDRTTVVTCDPAFAAYGADTVW
ncbi:MAG TPA: type II toxin-antitoxin system VapC family toxin [Solirubrobacteraceae bacterium]|jgi:PIN domain nuclease of toxin-antitoxin system|nr:type II toxin-antitoxin system VapC family toxin [Solirubrobacteraceae bacterium]